VTLNGRRPARISGRLPLGSGENRDIGQLLSHRHRMVQTRTRVMNQLEAVALNEGLRCKKRLWREAGREQLEPFRLAPWSRRRRRDLLKSYFWVFSIHIP
jgi:hypothetical protein